jgi:YfiR/HmsC-like
MAVLSSLRLAAVTVSAVALLGATAAGQRSHAGEEAIKAAFLYNFTKFIEWPESAFPGSSAPFDVCVFASEGFTREIRAVMYREQVRGRPVTVTVPGPGDALTACHVIYFGGGETERARKHLPPLRNTPVLTVGEGEGFLKQGGVIAFLLVNDRVRFDISKRGADGAGLIVSSKLLRVAREVDGVPGL